MVNTYASNQLDIFAIGHVPVTFHFLPCDKKPSNMQYINPFTEWQGSVKKVWYQSEPAYRAKYNTVKIYYPYYKSSIPTEAECNVVHMWVAAHYFTHGECVRCEMW